MEGQDVGAVKDPNGLPLFQAFVAVAQGPGQGFVPYQWPRPGSNEPVDKLGYVMAFKPWGWVVGSGIYVDDLRSAANRRLELVGVVLALALVLALYLFFSFYKVMDGGLKETRRHLKAMTDGDLTTTPAPWGRDEAAQLMLDLGQMQTALRHMVQRVRQSSDTLVHSSADIARSSAELSGRTEQTAANLEESAASMAQITGAVHKGSEHTGGAAEVARRNAEMAADGGRVMREVVATMAGIRGASAQIGEIIGSIDAIAFQTNILALNAAVEAARAGEQGRGFAVVASEVRTLAGRSAEAARQIKRLVGQSVEQVESGTAVVEQAGETIDHIVASSQQVDRLLGEVAQGAREQHAAVGQVGQAVQELDRMTQQNAQLVSDTTRTAAALRQQALQLSEEVARFKLPPG
jgi:methyl-accepting chemotaxis protein